ncbi:valine--tRNA ligase [Candidatus Uhrbacteria bacterium]|nr:valine--tRNA ligase [Candidatus Uhrbacteria bacterium]
MAKNEIPKAYEAKQYEDEIYAAWEKSGFFNPDNLPGKRTEMFSIVLPPPNVTGTLHMGHAVMLAIEDVMTRFARMRGKKALWIPGTDHAAIATQTKVEKLLMKDGMKDPRRELGREEFLKRVEKFASESHDVIVNQAKKMGASLDWTREAFTLDKVRNKAVNTAFKIMYDDGLIYRGDRMVNWCPRCKSTLADDEVEYKEQKTKFYYFKYGPVVIGTARPETKFADKVIVVHPNDDRYKNLIGKEMDVEWIEGIVKAKVIADEVADISLGSGAMTITPAHSFVDFDLAKKYDFEILKIIDEDGNLTKAAGTFAGKNAHDSREEIVSVLEKKGLVDHIDEDYVHNLSVCYRCGTAIEPLPKVQWFIDVNKQFSFRQSEHSPIKGIKNGQLLALKEIMQHVVRTKQIRIIPDRFEKTYFHWIDNLRDWNISRQIWYGHRVPVWYKQKSEVGDQKLETPFVGVTAPEGEDWQQDTDTLDTWFSAGLWTISTLGWPDQNNVLTSFHTGEKMSTDLECYHPTSVLETGYDILFFWVARMILMTTYTVGEVPFRDVYLHGLVRDEQGRKMSKSLDNIIDPLDMIEKFGADATRLSLVIGTTPGNDTKLSEEKIAGYRNFTNKLWNISRFVLLSLRGDEVDEVIPSEIASPLDQLVARNDMTLADRWILSRFATVTKEVTDHLENYEFSQAGEKLRDFTWGEFADWYLEIAKIQKQDGIGNKQEARDSENILFFVLKQLLVLWHPFMPFVTEAIWKNISSDLLIVESWPKEQTTNTDFSAEHEFSRVQQLIISIRNIRSQYKVRQEQSVDVRLQIQDSHTRKIIEENLSIIKTLARVQDIEIISQLPEFGSGFAVVVLDQITAHIILPIEDSKSEEARIQKESEKLRDYILMIENKFSDKEFVSKAPPQVVEKMRQKLQEAKDKLESYVSHSKS